MNDQVYTKQGKLRKRPPSKYIYKHNDQPCPESTTRNINMGWVTFVVGPNGEQLSDNPAHKEWMEERDKEIQRTIINRRNSTKLPV